MKKITISLIFMVLLLFTDFRTAFAMIAYPHLLEYRLPDGSTIILRLKGDEKVKWAENPDGYSILLNSEGFYEYAILDANGDMQRSGIRVSNLENRSAEEAAFLSGLQKGLTFSLDQIGIMKQIWEI